MPSRASSSSTSCTQTSFTPRASRTPLTSSTWAAAGWSWERNNRLCLSIPTFVRISSAGHRCRLGGSHMLDFVRRYTFLYLLSVSAAVHGAVGVWGWYSHPDHLPVLLPPQEGRVSFH